MMQGKGLELAGCNAVIVGNGVVGTAMADILLQQQGVNRVVILGRRIRSLPHDPRVSFLTIDAQDPQSLVNAAEQVTQSLGRVHLLVNTVGFLHGENLTPEKNLKAVTVDQLQRSFQLNATLLPLLAQAFSKLLRHDEPAVLASLSARVGSIEDNKLGGWYSYRASKAAHNMLLRSISREWRISHKLAIVVALHPGTVRSPLSEPFLGDRYPHRILTGTESAKALLDIITNLRPRDTGSFIDWQGKPIPW